MTMYLFRTRLSSFMAGFAAAAALSYYYLHQELQTGHHSIAEQVENYYSTLEARVSHLEKTIQTSSSDNGQA